MYIANTVTNAPCSKIYSLGSHIYTVACTSTSLLHKSLFRIAGAPDQLSAHVDTGDNANCLPLVALSFDP